MSQNCLYKNGNFYSIFNAGIHAAGKTQLSYLFCDSATEKGRIVHSWEIDCTQETTLDTGIQELLEVLHVPVKDKETTDKYLRKLSNVFRNTPGPNLLILDDINEDTIDTVNQIRKSLQNTVIIATTNDSTLFDESESIEVTGFSREETIKFLKQGMKIKNETESDMLKLGETLGFSPFGLSIAKSYICNYNLTIKAYIFKLMDEASLRCIEDKTCQKLKRYLNGYKKSKSFLQALQMSIQKLKKTLKKDLFDVFKMFAYLNPGYIPFCLLREACRQKCGHEDDDDAIDDDLSELINGLKESSIAVKDELSQRPVHDNSGSLRIHNGVQFVLRLWWSDKDGKNVSALQDLVLLLYPFLRRHIVYQDDFLQNSKLIAILAPYLPKMAQDISKEYIEENMLYCLKFVHVLDAITMTYIYRGLLQFNTKAKQAERHVRENVAEEFVSAACHIMEILVGGVDDKNEHNKRQKKQESQCQEECKLVLENIQFLIKNGSFTTDMTRKIIHDKYYEERDFVPLWKEKYSELTYYEDKFRISEDERGLLERNCILLPLSKMVDIYIPELYMSILYTKARIYVYKLRHNKLESLSVTHHQCYVDMLKLAEAIGCQIFAAKGIHLMYKDRVVIKGLHSLCIDSGSPENPTLEEVALQSLSIARDEEPAYEFGVLFKYKGKTMCNFKLYCLRQALNAYKELLKSKFDKKMFDRAKLLINEILDMLEVENGHFLGRGSIYTLLASVMAKSEEPDNLEQAWDLYIKGMDAERRNDKWNFAWRDGLNGLVSVAKRLNTTEHKTKAKELLVEYKTIVHKSDLSQLTQLMQDLELNGIQV